MSLNMHSEREFPGIFTGSHEPPVQKWFSEKMTGWGSLLRDRADLEIEQACGSRGRRHVERVDCGLSFVQEKDLVPDHQEPSMRQSAAGHGFLNTCRIIDSDL